MTKLAPEWVRTSDPVIRSPARYRWTTAPTCCVQWNTFTSDMLYVGNGVRQRGGGGAYCLPYCLIFILMTLVLICQIRKLGVISMMYLSII